MTDVRLTRRALCAQVAAVAAVASQVSLLPAPASAAFGFAAKALDIIGAAEMQGFVGTRFVVRDAQGLPVALELSAVEPFRAPGRRPRGLRQEGFVATLRPPTGMHLDGALYDVQHPAFGQFALLIEPARDGTLVAVFN